MHQDEALDKKIFNIIIKYSTSDNFSPNLYEFMVNYNNFKIPDEYFIKIKDNIFTKIYDNLYMKKNDNESFYSDLMMLIKDNYLTYNCTNCGYSSKSHIWQCPSCNSWETIAPNPISDRVNIDG